MIDFLSTNENIEQQAKGSAHLLAAVIAQAFNDLCISPSDTEKEKELNLNPHVVSSLQFFYEDPWVFNVYANMIGIDPKMLIEGMFSLTHQAPSLMRAGSKIPEKNIRIFRMRLRWFRRHQDRLALVRLRKKT